MAYQVLARKWRPRTFSEMLGQAHVVRALTNALDNNRLHHAYLFTGTRGVGKTTIARILSKSLNCEKGISSHPCGECITCREVDEGRFVDLIEVDAASRTGVDETRGLLDNVQYAPTRGRYKVYLIDEVHMLTKQSFNALLKTLEEPPPHVKFLFATTDPQKLLPTVLSRCLQFNLKRLPLESIAEHLKKIVEAENIDYELPALHLLAQAADGSVRDSLSLLDQAIAYGAGKLSRDDVNSMLGSLDRSAILDLLTTLADKNAVALLKRVGELASHNPDFMTVLADIISLLQRIALAQILPESIDKAEAESETLLRLANHLTPEEVQLFYQIALMGRRDLPFSPELRGGFEMILLRMLAFQPVSMAQIAYSPTAQQTPTIQAKSFSPMSQVSAHIDSTPIKSVGEESKDDWQTIARSLPLSAFVKQLALESSLIRCEGDLWLLHLPKEHKLLFDKERVDKIELAMRQQFGQSVRVKIQVGETDPEIYPASHVVPSQTIQSASATYAVKPQKSEDVAENTTEPPKQTLESSIEQDPFVSELKHVFGAEIKKITPR
jgi:DNA polymerase-3 subunit gamma/tau